MLEKIDKFLVSIIVMPSNSLTLNIVTNLIIWFCVLCCLLFIIQSYRTSLLFTLHHEKPYPYTYMPFAKTRRIIYCIFAALLVMPVFMFEHLKNPIMIFRF